MRALNYCGVYSCFLAVCGYVMMTMSEILLQEVSILLGSISASALAHSIVMFT